MFVVEDRVFVCVLHPHWDHVPVVENDAGETGVTSLCREISEHVG